MARFEELANRLALALPVLDAVLDGEIVATVNGVPLFNELLRGRGALGFAAYDLLWLDDKDMRPLPFWRRKRSIE